MWVNATEPREIDHADSRGFLRAIAARSLPVVVPTLVLVEVAATVGRMRGEQRSLRVTRLLAHWRAITFHDLDRALADAAADLARVYRLRGADVDKTSIVLEY